MSTNQCMTRFLLTVCFTRFPICSEFDRPRKACLSVCTEAHTEEYCLSTFIAATAANLGDRVVNCEATIGDENFKQNFNYQRYLPTWKGTPQFEPSLYKDVLDGNEIETPCAKPGADDVPVCSSKVCFEPLIIHRSPRVVDETSDWTIVNPEDKKHCAENVDCNNCTEACAFSCPVSLYFKLIKINSNYSSIHLFILMMSIRKCGFQCGYLVSWQFHLVFLFLYQKLKNL